MTRRTTLAVATIAGIAIGATPVIACPDGQYESLGMCFPEIGGAVGQGAEHIKKEWQAQAIGLPLEQFINVSHSTALNGSMPIPWYIRQQLAGFSDPDAMNRVRYKIGDNGALNLAHLIEQWRFYDVAAVTLIDVVVFRGPTEANDVCTWAHELVHVGQYRDWGVHSFAIVYARNPNDAEDAAYAKERQCRAQLSMSGQMAAPPPVIPVPQMGAYCLTPYGRFGPGPMQPVGSPCYIQTMQGVMWGQYSL